VATTGKQVRYSKIVVLGLGELGWSGTSGERVMRLREMEEQLATCING
jgi:hypothetical protein